MKSKHIILTSEERSVLLLSAQLLTNEDIAESLDMSVTKVKTLIHQASAKLGAHNRLAACTASIMRGHISLDEVYSPDELAEYLPGLDPDVLIEIAQVVHQSPGYRIIQGNSDKMPHTVKKQGNILTECEREILILVGHGLTNKDIAARLGISANTVRNMLNKVCSKLGARSRGDAFVLALRQGAIEISEVLSFDEIRLCLAHYRPESLEKMAQLLRNKREQKCLRTDG